METVAWILGISVVLTIGFMLFHPLETGDENTNDKPSYKDRP